MASIGVLPSSGNVPMAETTGQISDVQLLAAIAKRRDKASFETLVNRYFKSSYNLCCRLCDDKQMAEDATQEAMMTLWHRAHVFDPKLGQARSWILRIVAQQALQSRRKVRREDARIQVWKNRESQPVQKPTSQAEEKELLVSLNGLLDDLSERDRKLVALYYGAGLSQAEISRQLKIPQRTISQKLSRVVNELRSGLSQVGFASVASLESHLGDAVLGGLEAPVISGDQIAAWLSSSAMAGSSVRATSSKGALSPAGWAGVSIFIMTALFAVTWAAQNPSREAKAKAPLVPDVGASPAVASPDVVQAARPAPVDPGPWVWSFQKSGLEDQVIRIPDTGWHWGPSIQVVGKSFFRQIEKDAEAYLLFPQAIPQSPALIELDFKPTRESENVYCMLRLASRKEIISQKIYTKRRLMMPVKKILRLRFFLWSGRCAVTIQNQVERMVTFSRSSEPLYPVVFIKNSMVHQVRMRSLPLDKFPENVLQCDEKNWSAEKYSSAVLPGEIQDRLRSR